MWEHCLEPEQPHTLIAGKNYILIEDSYCYRIVTADTRSQVFGTYSYETAKKRFNELEYPNKKER